MAKRWWRAGDRRARGARKGEFPMRDCTQFYIDGQWVDPVTENTVAVENPATEETIGHI